MAKSTRHSSKEAFARVLNAKQIEDLIRKNKISVGDKSDLKQNIQPASIDLSLGDKAYRLQSSFLPQSSTVKEKMKELVMYEVDLTGEGGILERGAVYLVPLKESLDLTSDYRGKTNPKSSTGRLDVFTRVITDKCARFEEIVKGYKGELFLEVVPRSFTIKVKTGQKLNQLRIFKLGFEEAELQGISENFAVGNEIHSYIHGEDLKKIYKEKRLLCDDDGNFIKQGPHVRDDGILMSVDLVSPNGTNSLVGYKAKKNSQVVDLEKIGYYYADDFWETLHPPRNGRLILEPEEFYIFASKERIRVPLDCAAEMVEFDAGSGELRTHYAGFFDPGFGYGGKGEVLGTKAVLEVRPHDVPFIIEDGQILFKMKYERMSSPPEIWYGTELGSNYHDQTLRLAKQFRK